MVIGCSIDSWFTLKAWIESGTLAGGVTKIDYPMLSDLTKNISRDYGVLNETVGFALRGTFLIDPNGVVQKASINPAPLGRDVDAVLRDLTALSLGKPCPVNWKRGQPTL